MLPFAKEVPEGDGLTLKYNMREKIFTLLDDLEIEYTNYEHEPAFTCDDAKGIDIPGKRVKSLLLKNKQKNNFYMVVIEDEKRLDSSIIRKYFWESKVSFVSEELMVEKIWLRPGHVSPFAMINNQEKDITVVFDTSLQWSEIWIHPLQNDNTIVIKMENITKFLENLEVNFTFIEL